MSPTQQSPHRLRGHVNHFALLKYDADHLVDLARNQPNDFNNTVLARSAILLYIVSLEALINRVIEDFWPTGPGVEPKNEVLMWSTVDKWSKVPKAICGKTFEVGGRPFQYLKPLFQVRNDYVHAKPDTFELVWEYRPNAGADEIPVAPAKEHPKYAQIDLLGDPHEWIAVDAVRIKTITEELIDGLRRLLDPRLTDRWLHEDMLTDEQGRTFYVQRRYRPPEQT